MNIDRKPDQPVWAVKNCLAFHVKPGQRVTLGLSGGLDSVALLAVLAELVDEGEVGWQLSAVHINHAISKAADEWEGYCQRYCAILRVPFTSVRVEVERASADGLEAAARRARYAAFKALETDWVVLAHHQDDQAETLLFNLIRGSGLAGASAMPERLGRFLRPWLTVSRQEIESFARHHDIHWCEDDSNTDVRFSRNFLRHKVIPELKRRFPQVAKNLAGGCQRFAEAIDLLDDLACLDLSDQTMFPVSIESMKKLSEPRARNVFRYLLARQDVKIPSEARLREALRQMLYARNDRHPSVNLGAWALRRRSGWIYLESSEDSCDKR